MSSYDAEVMARQLSQLGRDLQAEVIELGNLSDAATDAEGEYYRLKAIHDDAVDLAFLNGEGGVEARKAKAKIECAELRGKMLDANTAWSRAKGAVSTQYANLNALHKRVDIGRSMLSRERALLSLANSGVDT